jgi:xanthine dehydrogenase YagR molybdenum-binding subunit
VLSREGVYRTIGGRAPTEQRVAIGAQADGRFDALIHTGTVVKTRHNALAEPFITATRCLYAAGSMKLGIQAAYLDMLSNTFMRAPGEAVGSFALESAIDELAERIGMDPIELRIRNEPDNDPTSGLPFSSRHLIEAYRAGAERFEWNQREPRPGVRREGMGMGTATAQAQIAAERLGLPLDQVTFTYGESSLPGAVLAGGSQQTASSGAAVVAAHRELVAEILKLAGDGSPLAGLGRDEAGAVDGGLCDLSDPQRWESYASILTGAERDEVSAEAAAPMGARGIGEIGITGVGAAVANAVYNATGTRVRDLPITLDKLL